MGPGKKHGQSFKKGGPVKWISVPLVLVAAFFLLSATFRPARADNGDDFSCDSLTSLAPEGNTVWNWFLHPCPPAPGEESPAILPGVGITLQGFWIPPTLYNPTGTPVSANLPLINSQVQNGYGGGLGITGWLASNLALRFQVNLWTFPPQSGQYAFTMMPILLGFEVKLLGGNRVYLYVAGDGGIAMNGQNASNAFQGTGISPYAQASAGINFYALQFEGGYGVLLSPQGGAGGAGIGGRTNPFFIIPLSVGFHL